jgi:hypothetical protein
MGRHKGFVAKLVSYATKNDDDQNAHPHWIGQVPKINRHLSVPV